MRRLFTINTKVEQADRIFVFLVQATQKISPFTPHFSLRRSIIFFLYTSTYYSKYINNDTNYYSSMIISISHARFNNKISEFSWLVSLRCDCNVLSLLQFNKASILIHGTLAECLLFYLGNNCISEIDYIK